MAHLNKISHFTILSFQGFVFFYTSYFILTEIVISFSQRYLPNVLFIVVSSCNSKSSLLVLHSEQIRRKLIIKSFFCDFSSLTNEDAYTRLGE